MLLSFNTKVIETKMVQEKTISKQKALAALAKALNCLTESEGALQPEDTAPIMQA